MHIIDFIQAANKMIYKDEPDYEKFKTYIKLHFQTLIEKQAE